MKRLSDDPAVRLAECRGEVADAHLMVSNLTDDEVLEAMRPHIYAADGGYVYDTAKVELLAAGRALLACARQKAEMNK